MFNSYKVLGLVFDIIAAIVSLLDLATDVIVMITWYTQNRMIFFYISLGILILAQISYITIFYYNHGCFDTPKDLAYTTISILLTLPFTPFLSFLFYLVGDREAWMRGFIDTYLVCYHFDWNNNYIDPNSTPQQKYLEDKLYKHLGFLMEALIEAFPQSILQLTAIVYYNEPNIISIVSILISMCSVCSKIFLLTLTGDTRGWKIKLLTWLCFVADFFGVFWMISFAFHRPTNFTLQYLFLNIRSLYFYEFIIAIVPFAVVGSIGLHLYWTVETSKHTPLKCQLFLCCGITMIWIIGLFMTFLAMKIFCIWWFGIVIISLASTQRLPYDKLTKQFYINHMRWIVCDANNIIDANDGSILITKERDKILRLCVFNQMILELHPTASIKDNDPFKKYNWWENIYNDNLLVYLRTEQPTQYKNVTLKDIRLNSINRNYSYPYDTHEKERIPNPFIAYYYEFYASLFRELNHRSGHLNCAKRIAVITMFWLTYIAGPIYILSRVLNIFIPLFIPIYFYMNGIILWIDIDVFQVIMWTVYIILLFIWFTLLVLTVKDEYILWHVLPTTTRFKACDNQHILNGVSKLIRKRYEKLTVLPIIEKIVNETFGIDIGYLIMEYFIAIDVSDL